ncbi:MAG: N-acetylmuramoyl-L-alanine amidase, partial [Bacteroidetes bacterium]|nr:N-acetylmuramoyl-L-alanine amidase [Bacteroidota bacterium]
MKKLLPIFASLLLACNIFSQTVKEYEQEIALRYSDFFEEAYQIYPGIPSGMLEAIAYTNTRIRHVNPDAEEPGCTGLPASWGVMGLVGDGKGYFRNNLATVADLSGYTITEIKSSPRINILAYAASFHALMYEHGVKAGDISSCLYVVEMLSELPDIRNDIGNDYAMNTHLYSVVSFLNSPEKRQLYGFEDHIIDMEFIFGEQNLKVLSAGKIIVSDKGVETENGATYQLRSTKTACPDYPVPHCSWVASPNYSSRNGATISAIAIHTVQGSYAGCISWFQNSSASASTHYVVRSSDGQLTQMVYESEKAWHIGVENPYAIGYEHEGYVDDPVWYTMPMYQSSADLTRDVCNAWNINPLRMFYRDTLDDGTVLDYGLHSLGGEGFCIKIKGHQHFPNNTHTDPGPYWTWDLYFKLVNENPAITTLTSATGNYYDSGGASGNYADDERILTLIQPPNAGNITITFTSWSLEADYDFLYIYDGDNEFAPR